ncbi:MAG: hypothetical protein ACKOFI_12900, partial [Phycisphaerales bacterium]
QGGAFVTEDLEVFGAWNYNTISTEASNSLQVGANWYFAKNNMKMTVLATIPLNMNAGEQAANSDAGGSFGMVDNGNVGNNFGLVVQLQLMF